MIKLFSVLLPGTNVQETDWGEKKKKKRLQSENLQGHSLYTGKQGSGEMDLCVCVQLSTKETSLILSESLALETAEGICNEIEGESALISNVPLIVNKH